MATTYYTEVNVEEQERYLCDERTISPRHVEATHPRVIEIPRGRLLDLSRGSLVGAIADPWSSRLAKIESLNSNVMDKAVNMRRC